MANLFISYPSSDNLPDDVKAIMRARMHKIAENLIGKKMTVLPRHSEDFNYIKNLAKNIETLSLADYIVGLQYSSPLMTKECLIEHYVADQYGVPGLFLADRIFADMFPDAKAQETLVTGINMVPEECEKDCTTCKKSVFDYRESKFRCILSMRLMDSDDLPKDCPDWMKK